MDERREGGRGLRASEEEGDNHLEHQRRLELAVLAAQRGEDGLPALKVVGEIDQQRRHPRLRVSERESARTSARARAWGREACGRRDGTKTGAMVEATAATKRGKEEGEARRTSGSRRSLPASQSVWSK